MLKHFFPNQGGYNWASRGYQPANIRRMGDNSYDDVFEAFIDRYSSPVFSALAKLTGLSDERELETLTVNVFVDLWNNSEELFKNIKPVAYIYKVLLRHVFSYLKTHNREEHISVLRETLLIDPSHYINILE